MPGTNQFLPFAVGAGANTLTPAAYAALTSLLSGGFVAGVANSAQFNTALRQATTAAAGLAQFIANQGINANDDGSASNFAAGVQSAIRAAVPVSRLQPVDASVAANALTVTLAPTTLDFRSLTLTSGAVNTRNISAQLSLTVPSGATLGATNGVSARLVVLALDSAGTIELAITNLAGSLQLDETGLISTTAISAAATAANVIYSQTARTNVPYRVVGFVDSNQATAGTYASAPLLVQGAGGQALSGIVDGRSWQDVTASRALGTTYYNTTGRPIAVMVRMQASSASDPIITVGATQVYGTGGASGVSMVAYADVPVGSSYSATAAAGTPALISWKEMR